MLAGQLIFMSAVTTWWETGIVLDTCAWQEESVVDTSGALGSSLEISDGAFSRATSFIHSDGRDFTGKNKFLQTIGMNSSQGSDVGF